jgi:hypothetical protein
MEDEIEIEAIVIDAGSGTVKVVILPKLLQFVRMCVCMKEGDASASDLIYLSLLIQTRLDLQERMRLDPFSHPLLALSMTQSASHK